MTTTPEQAARDMLERMDIENAQSFTAGDVVELANLIAEKECMPRCTTCKHWVPANEKYPRNHWDEDKQAGGLCESPKLTEDHEFRHDADMLVYPYTEGGEFWTGPKFGCVNHEAKS